MGKYLLVDVMQLQVSLYFVTCTLPGYVIFETECAFKMSFYEYMYNNYLGRVCPLCPIKPRTCD